MKKRGYLKPCAVCGDRVRLPDRTVCGVCNRAIPWDLDSDLMQEDAFVEKVAKRARAFALRRMFRGVEAPPDDAFKRGVAAMRKAAVTRCDEMAADFRRRGTANDDFKGMGAELCAAAVETVKGLPDPEDKP